MNKRLAEIILILLKYEDYITIDLIAKSLRVSNRTIRNDLKILDELLPPMGLSLIKKTGMGIFLEGSVADKLKVYDTFKHSKIEQQIDSPQDRHNYILLKLCTVDHYRIFEFVEELYVSRATIHKDLIILENFLNKFKIKLERSNTLGLSLIGRERDIRTMMFDVCASTGSSSFASIIKHKENACNGQFVYQGLDLTDDEINHFIDLSRLKYISTFTEQSLEALSQIAIHLLITMIRAKMNKPIKLSDGFINELKQKPFLNEASELLDNIEKGYKIVFSEDEKYYIQVFVLAFQLDESSVNFGAVEFFVNTVIKYWSIKCNLSLESDEILKNTLTTHMIPVFTRIKHGISVENDLMHEIKQRYKNTYTIVEKSIQKLEFWNQMRPEDIGFITLHLAASLERNKKTLNTLLVHGTFAGAKLLLQSKIKNNLPEIRITEEMNIAEYQPSFAQNFDLIVSTVQLNAMNTPIIIINNIMTDNDIIRLKNYITPIIIEKNSPRDCN